LVSACSKASPPKNCSFVGDPTAALELGYPFVLEQPGDAGHVEPPDGGAVPLRRPVQGGFVLYVGALLRNLDPCSVSLQAELKDPQSGVAVSNLDQRSTDLEPSTVHPGWWQPTDLDSLSTVPNIPACPDALGRGAADKPATIELTATDAQHRTATISALVTPTCPADSLQVDCQ
jgi:hypothetical protein